MPSPKVLFTSDLRSNAELYAELVEYSDKVRPQIVLFGGDLFGGDPREQVRFARGPFEETLGALGSLGVGGVGVLPGNDDWNAPLEALHDSELRASLHFVDAQPWELEHGINIVGYGFTPLTPFSVKDFEKLDHYRPDKLEVLEAHASGVVSSDDDVVATIHLPLDGTETIEKDLAALDASIRAGRTIFVSHCPPRNTQLDLAYGRHAGSQALREFLLRTQPAISLHGHVSQIEQRHGEFAELLNQTLVVNPGQGSPLHAVVFDADRPAETLEHSVKGAWRDPRTSVRAALESTARQSPEA
jgi:Icc-related predicted phosphoesterase